jgi:hypothetical protein
MRWGYYVKIFFAIVILAANIFLLSGCQGGGGTSGLGRTYYVDGESGDDRNVGMSARKAWKSIERVNRVEFRPGDKLLFKGNWSYSGTLLFDEKDAGALEKPIFVSSFGNGRAVINGGEATAFRLDGSKYVVVGNMAFVGSGRKSGNNGSGVVLRRTVNVELDMLEVSGFRFSGVSTVGDENTRITRVYAHDNGFAGISTSPNDRDEKGEVKGRYRAKNLYIGYCVAENNPGDVQNLTNHSGNGIVVGGFDGGLIEYCRAFNNGWDMPRKGITRRPRVRSTAGGLTLTAVLLIRYCSITCLIIITVRGIFCVSIRVPSRGVIISAGIILVSMTG